MKRQRVRPRRRTDGRCGGGEKKDKNGLTRPVARSVINLCRQSVGLLHYRPLSLGLARSLAPLPPSLCLKIIYHSLRLPPLPSFPSAFGNEDGVGAEASTGCGRAEKRQLAGHSFPPSLSLRPSSLPLGGLGLVPVGGSPRSPSLLPSSLPPSATPSLLPHRQTWRAGQSKWQAVSDAAAATARADFE